MDFRLRVTRPCVYCELGFSAVSDVRFPLKVIVELRRRGLLLLVSETVTPVTVSETTGAPKDFPAITRKSFRKMGLLQINATPFPVQVNYTHMTGIT